MEYYLEMMENEMAMMDMVFNGHINVEIIIY
jgi:hypothetical protein